MSEELKAQLKRTVYAILKRWDQDNDYSFDMLIDDLRAALAPPAPAGWISVKDRLPPPFQEVLVHPRPTDYCCEARVNTQGDWYYSEYEPHFGENTHKCKVTHYMLMPAAPNAQEQP